MRSVAVIGAGIFGATIAIRAAEAGLVSILIEESNGILLGASGANQYRIHSGYHYPRSAFTGAQARSALPLFLRQFGAAIDRSQQHIYGLARSETKTTRDRFLNFCDEQKLPLVEKIVSDYFNPAVVEAAYVVQELGLDVVKARSLIRSRLADLGVEVHLNASSFDLALQSDFVVVAGYANNNRIGKKFGIDPKPQRYEVCEKPVTLMPALFRGQSLVVMDGEFACCSPMGTSPYHVWGHVKHGICEENEGDDPIVPDRYTGLLNKGVCAPTEFSKFCQFRSDGGKYIPGFLDSIHVGSMYTVKSVPCNVDDTDERPTSIEVVNGNVFRIWSGKIANCVQVADQVVNAIVG